MYLQLRDQYGPMLLWVKAVTTVHTWSWVTTTGPRFLLVMSYMYTWASSPPMTMHSGAPGRGGGQNAARMLRAAGGMRALATTSSLPACRAMSNFERHCNTIQGTSSVRGVYEGLLACRRQQQREDTWWMGQWPAGRQQQRRPGTVHTAVQQCKNGWAGC